MHLVIPRNAQLILLLLHGVLAAGGLCDVKRGRESASVAHGTEVFGGEGDDYDVALVVPC